MKFQVMGTGVEMTGTQAAIVAGVLVLGVWFVVRKGKQAVKEAAQVVNPLNPDNAFNTGFNATFQAVTGAGKDESFGTWLAGWIHGDPTEALRK